MRAALLVIYAASACCCSNAVRVRRQTSQEALEALLAAGYDVQSAPKPSHTTHRGSADIIHRNESVQVNLSIHLSSLEETGKNGEEYEVHITLRQNWEDSRLKFNTTDVAVPAVVERSLLWTPGLSYSANGTYGPFHNLKETTPEDDPISISDDGMVQYDTDLSLNFTCPFDETAPRGGFRVCSFIVASLDLPVEQVTVSWDPDYAVTASPDVNGPLKEHELILPGFRKESCDFKMNSDGRHSCVSVNLLVSRPDSVTRTVLEAYLPLGMLVLLADLSLWCPAGKRGTRMWIAAVLFLVTVLAAVLVVLLTSGVRDPLTLKCWAAACVTLADLPLIAIADGERQCHCSCCAWVELSYLERATALLLPAALLLVCIAFWLVLRVTPAPPADLLPLWPLNDIET
ncbi:hypothetical protein B566_EDAN005223 [Ephemera danica]|nr:hypothetical protein B566_EDAN005223 [Ephemera danica]